MITSYFITAISFLLGAMIASLIINKLVLRFAKTLGIRNKNDVVVRWSHASKPSLGGISLYITFIIGVIGYAVLFPVENIFEDTSIVGLLTAATLAFVIGLSDDAYNTKPLLKFLGQVCCGLIFVFTDNSIEFFQVSLLDNMLTVIWVVAVMNSLNMLDNMDGITGTVSFFILLTCVAVFQLFHPGLNPVCVVLISIELGALIGFLYYNVHPAKLFMGDTGSQFIALFVSYFGIKALWNLPSELMLPSWTNIFVVFAAFTPTIADTLSVVINRVKRGDSPMLGGKDHTTHHLVYSGKSDRKVGIIFFIISCFSAITAIFVSYFITINKYSFTWLGLFYFAIVFILLHRITLKYKRTDIKKDETD